MSKYEQDNVWEKREGRLDDARERIRRQIAERKAAGTYVSEADQQKAWAAKVASTMDPLIKAAFDSVPVTSKNVSVCPYCEDCFDGQGRCSCVAHGRGGKP